MPCQNCLGKCQVRPCVEELLPAYECCGHCDLPFLLGPNLDLEAGTIIGQRTTDLRFYPFDPNASDGTQLPRAILRYHVRTDDQGNVIDRYFGPLGLGLECGQPYTNAWVCGIFRLQDLFGDVAAAAASGWLKLIDGNPGGSGLVRI